MKNEKIDYRGTQHLIRKEVNEPDCLGLQEAVVWSSS